MDWSLVYFVCAILILPVFIYGAICQSSVNSTFNKYSKVAASSGMTASEFTRKLLDQAGLTDIDIDIINGRLTDCYDPKHKVVKLSKATHDNCSIAALGVCAHEVGHAIQDKNKSFLFRLRIALVPVVNFCTRLFLPMVLFGSILSFTLYIETVGYYITWAGVIMYGASMIFSLVTLPLESDASKKALQLLRESDSVSSEEIARAKEVLNAAKQTYVAALLTSILYFLKFLSYAMIFRRD